MSTYGELSKYLKGSKTIYEILNVSMKNMIRLAFEIFLLGLVISVYTETIRYESIIISSIIFILGFIAGIITLRIYSSMHNAFISTYENINARDTDEIFEHEKCLKDSKAVLHLGITTTIVNICMLIMSFVVLCMIFVLVAK